LQFKFKLFALILNCPIFRDTYNASFFITTCKYVLKKYNLEDKWIVQQQIGQLYFLGTNVHTYFNSSFFKDHDFVTIENKKTGEIIAVDPTVNDYLFIDNITYVK